MLTVVDELNPGQPERWQDAAKICVSQIFDLIDKSLDQMNSQPHVARVISSKNEEIDPCLEAVLEGLHRMDVQFEGMVNNSNCFDSDQMYWTEEWKILGVTAAAAGIKNGELLPLLGAPGPLDNHPEFEKIDNPAAAGEFDSWMIREQITETLIRKQMDYGHNNIARFGRIGLIIRTHDKLARLRNLHLSSNNPQNEALTDTYVDIIGYSAIGMMWERGWFLLDIK